MQISDPVFYFAVWPLLALFALPLALRTGWGQSPAKSKGFFAGLEGLRGILALNVFFHHALITYFFLQTGIWADPASRFYAKLGPVSVAMFFFITGFLFWSKLMAAQRLPMLEFLAARWRRLMPAYLGSFAAIALITAWQTHFALHLRLKAVVFDSLSCFFCGLPAGFPDINAFPSAQINANVFWTLRIEWLFYLVLPFLAWFTVRGRVFWLPILSGATAVIVWTFFHLKIHRLGFLGSPHVWEYSLASFCIGILAAFCKVRRNDWPALRHPACSLLAILLFAAVLALPPRTLGPIQLCLLGLILLVVIYGNTFFGLLTSRPILFLGAISYSVYLLHGIVLYLLVREMNPVLHFLRLSPAEYWAYISCTGAVVILAASASFRCLEKPFLGKRPTVEVTAPVPAVIQPVMEQSL